MSARENSCNKYPVKLTVNVVREREIKMGRERDRERERMERKDRPA